MRAIVITFLVAIFIFQYQSDDAQELSGKVTITNIDSLKYSLGSFGDEEGAVIILEPENAAYMK